MKNIVIVSMLACPLFCCAMEDKKRKAGHYLQEAKKTKQDPQAEGIVAGFEKMKLSPDHELENKLAQENKVALRSYDEKNIFEFDVDTMSLVSTYYTLLKDLRGGSALPSWEHSSGFEKTSELSLLGGIYTFEEGTSPDVIKRCIAYFTNPGQLSDIKEDILKNPNQAFQMWYNVKRLGVEPLETFVAENIFEMYLRDKDVQRELLDCVDRLGKVDAHKLKKVFIACFGGDTQVFDDVFENHYYKNPKYWDLKNPIQEIKMDDGKPVHRVTVSSTEKYVTAEIKNECLHIYKKNCGIFEEIETIELLRHDMKGGSYTMVAFSPDDSLCVVEQKRGLYESLQVYDCKNWKMIDKLEDQRASLKNLAGFTKDNALILVSKGTISLYDVAQKKMVQIPDRSALEKSEKSVLRDLEKEALLKAREYVELLGTYEEPYRFEFKRIDATYRYALVPFNSIAPGTQGSGLISNVVIFDCEKKQGVRVFSDSSDMDFFLDGAGFVDTSYEKSWYGASESKICFYGTTLQGIVEKLLGDDFFKRLQSTSFFSFSSFLRK